MELQHTKAQKFKSNFALRGFLILLLLLTTNLALASLPKLLPMKKTEHIAYFSTLPFRESPFADLKGIHRISASEAKIRNHYRFEYDEQYRPIRVTFMLGDTPRPTNQTANFFFRTTRIDISYQTNHEVRTFFDRFGNPALARGIYKEIYEIDAAGYRKRLTFENADGTKAQSEWGVAEYLWQVENDGTVIEKHLDLNGSTVVKRPNLTFYTLRLHYGPNGWLSLMENYGPKGNTLMNNTMKAAQDKLEYDANGDMRAWNVFDENEVRVRGNSPDVHRGSRDFNQHGYIERTYYEDAQGKRIKSAYGWGESTTQYDSFGNLIERWTHTPEGDKRAINPRLQYSGYIREWDKTGLMELSRQYMLANGKSPATHENIGVHKVRFEYDNGNRTRILHYDAAGTLVPSRDFGAAIIEFKFDEKKRVIERRLLDSHEALTNHPDGWAKETFEYDRFGMRGQGKRFDKNNNLIVEAP